MTPRSVAPIISLQGTKGYPALSPDGQQVAFAWTGSSFPVTQKNDIYVKLVNGGEPLRLTDDAADEIAPAWSPDGSVIAFLREEGARDGNVLWGVYTVAALGGPARRICAAGPGTSWSPDGESLVIASLPDDKGRNHIVRVNLKTGDRKDLTAGPYSDSFPVFSPDGKHIAFLRSFTRFARELMILPDSGGEPIRLTWDQHPIYGATWTPDSRSIVYACARGAGGSLWRVSTGGGQPELVVTSAGAFQPSMSLHGKRLVYLESYIDSNLYLYEGAALGSRRAPGRFEPGREQPAALTGRGAPSLCLQPHGERRALGGAATGRQCPAVDGDERPPAPARRAGVRMGGTSRSTRGLAAAPTSGWSVPTVPTSGS